MYLTDAQRARLAALAELEQISEAEVIRRILDQALELRDDTDEKVAAIEGTAGVLPHAPDWPDWLAAVRGRGTSRRLRALGL